MQANQRNVKILTDFDKIRSCKMKIDTGRLQQVLLNLLTNAIKFSHEGGKIKVTAWIDEIEESLQEDLS